MDRFQSSPEEWADQALPIAPLLSRLEPRRLVLLPHLTSPGPAAQDRACPPACGSGFLVLFAAQQVVIVPVPALDHLRYLPQSVDSHRDIRDLRRGSTQRVENKVARCLRLRIGAGPTPTGEWLLAVCMCEIRNLKDAT